MNCLLSLRSITCNCAFRCFLTLFPVFFAEPVASDPAVTVYRYRQSKGATTDTVKRSVTHSSKETIISFVNAPDICSKGICDPEMRNSSWHFESKETGYNVTAARIGDTIRISGQKGQKAIRQARPIDSLPWYQSLEFSLEPFLGKGGETRDFWMVRPTDMSVFKMTVRREGVDTIMVNRRFEPAIRVILSPAGVAGRFWKGTYWFRTGDCSFLRSSLPQGIPGAPPLIMEVIEDRDSEIKYCAPSAIKHH